MVAAETVSYYLFSGAIGFKMTPRDQEAWALCFLELGLAMLWYMARKKETPLLE